MFLVSYELDILISSLCSTQANPSSDLSMKELESTIRRLLGDATKICW